MQYKIVPTPEETHFGVILHEAKCVETTDGRHVGRVSRIPHFPSKHTSDHAVMGKWTHSAPGFHTFDSREDAVADLIQRDEQGLNWRTLNAK